MFKKIHTALAGKSLSNRHSLFLMLLVPMLVQSHLRWKCRPTAVAGVLIGSREMNTFNMNRNIVLLAIHFATNCAHKLSSIRPISHFS